MPLKISLYGRLTLLVLIALLISTPAVSTDAERVIELKDGSRISGAVIDYRNGIYTIESGILGRLQLPDAKIQSIHSPSARNKGPGLTSFDAATLSQYEHIQNRIMVNPEVLPLVLSLQQDPGVLDILNDPEIMQAIASGQVVKLQNNPKIRRLESNPTIQEIIQVLSQ